MIYSHAFIVIRCCRVILGLLVSMALASWSLVLADEPLLPPEPPAARPPAAPYSVFAAAGGTVFLPLVATPIPERYPAVNRADEQELLYLLNTERVARGLDPLTEAGPLTQAARRHSADMARHGIYSHIGSDGTHSWDRMWQEGWTGQTGGETIYRGRLSPAAAVEGFLHSPAHASILLADWNRFVGIGYSLDTDGIVYWTVDLGH